jgi:hypothetical protein
MSAQIRINYKEYPEFMFAMISAYLPGEDGDLLRTLAGSVVFRHEDHNDDTFKNGLRHSYDDKAAVIRYCDGYSSWYKDGKLHRNNDLPAIICNGYKEWRIHGMIHRDNDLPAVEFPNYSAWYINNIRHRDEGKPAIIDGNYRAWYINGKLINRTRI